MSRSALSFLLFCLLLLVAGGVLVQWVGPVLVKLAFDDERKDLPYRVLYFSDADSTAATEAWQTGLRALLMEEGAVTVWRAARLDLVDGSLTDEWRNLLMVEYPSARHFVQVATGSAYRELLGGGDALRVQALGTSGRPELNLAGFPRVLLYLFGDIPDPDAAPPDRLQAAAATIGGVRLWRAPVDPLSADAAPWRQLLVIGFPAAEPVAPWLHDPAMVTERALLRTRTRALAGWLIQPGAATPAPAADGAAP